MANRISGATIAMIAGGVGLSVVHAMPLSQSMASTSQNPPPIVVIGPDADIVVTGPHPVIRGGLWEFTRSGTIRQGLPGPGRTTLPFRFSVCLPDATLENTLRSAAGEQSPAPHRNNRCGALRMTAGKGRITGQRSCIRPLVRGDLKPGSSKLDISGRYDTKTLTINYLAEDVFEGIERVGGPGWDPQRPQSQRWRVTASRAGDCPAQPRVDQRTPQQAVVRLFDPSVVTEEDADIITD